MSWALEVTGPQGLEQRSTTQYNKIGEHMEFSQQIRAVQGAKLCTCPAACENTGLVNVYKILQVHLVSSCLRCMHQVSTRPSRAAQSRNHGSVSTTKRRHMTNHGHRPRREARKKKSPTAKDLRDGLPEFLSSPILQFYSI